MMGELAPHRPRASCEALVGRGTPETCPRWRPSFAVSTLVARRSRFCCWMATAACCGARPAGRRELRRRTVSATDAETLLGSVEALMVAAFEGAKLSNPLVAVAVAGVGEDGVPVNEAGVALDTAIPWFDRRASALAEAMAARAPWQDAPLPVALDYSRTAAKWAWARAHRPAPLAAAKNWVALTDYPAVRWSGQHFMSESLAARTACWHVGHRAWMKPLLDDCGAPPLPEVVRGGTVLGKLHSPRLEAAGVVDGHTSVVAGGHDHPVAAVAIRQGHPTAIIDSMGTAELIYAELPDGRQAAAAASLLRFLASGSGRWDRLPRRDGTLRSTWSRSWRTGANSGSPSAPLWMAIQCPARRDRGQPFGPVSRRSPNARPSRLAALSELGRSFGATFCRWRLGKVGQLPLPPRQSVRPQHSRLRRGRAERLRRGLSCRPCIRLCTTCVTRRADHCTRSRMNKTLFP